MNNRIVLIEDDSNIADNFKKILVDSGYLVTCLRYEFQLESYVQLNKPDLLILGFNLKNHTGFDIIMEAIEDIPYLVISGDLDKNLEYPFPYLVEPVEEQELLVKIREIMQIPKNY